MHYGGQLFVVAYENEASYAVVREYAYDVRFENLTCLIDYRQRELLYCQQLWSCRHRRCGAHHYILAFYLVAQSFYVLCPLHRCRQHMSSVCGVAAAFVAYAQVVLAGTLQHGAYLIDSPVGVCHEEEGFFEVFLHELA